MKKERTKVPTKDHIQKCRMHNGEHWEEKTRNLGPNPITISTKKSCKEMGKRTWKDTEPKREGSQVASLAATTAPRKIVMAWTLCNNGLTQDSGGLNFLKCLGLKLLWGVLWSNFYEILNSQVLWIFLGIRALTRVKKGPLLKSICSTNKRKGL